MLLLCYLFLRFLLFNYFENLIPIANYLIKIQTQTDITPDFKAKVTVTCDGHRLTYCRLHLYLQCHCGCSSSNPLSPMRTVSWVSCCAADDPCFVAYATEHTLAVGFGRQGRVHRKCKWVSGFPCTPEFNNVESISPVFTLHHPKCEIRLLHCLIQHPALNAQHPRCLIAAVAQTQEQIAKVPPAPPPCARTVCCAFLSERGCGETQAAAPAPASQCALLAVEDAAPALNS